jgi:hypothetical protein
VHDIHTRPWWPDHVIGGMMSYWVYQHLGNLSPDEIREEGMLEQFIKLGDATEALTEWARRAEKFTPVGGAYRFSFYRDLGNIRVVVIDSRNGRVLEPGRRRMVDDAEWAWVQSHADVGCEHLVLATSVPVVMPGGMHDLERWDERLCDGAWGRPFVRLGEKVRRALDLEDWSAFHDSYLDLMRLIRNIATPGREPSADPPATVSILSGDVHFSFRSRATLEVLPGKEAPQSRVYQIVNSPIRNILATRERRAIKVGLSRFGLLVGRMLRRASGAPKDPNIWDVEDGPFFANHVCVLEFSGREATMVLERAEPDDDGNQLLTLAAKSDL